MRQCNPGLPFPVLNPEEQPFGVVMQDEVATEIKHFHVVSSWLRGQDWLRTTKLLFRPAPPACWREPRLGWLCQ